MHRNILIALAMMLAIAGPVVGQTSHPPDHWVEIVDGEWVDCSIITASLGYSADLGGYYSVGYYLLLRTLAGTLTAIEAGANFLPYDFEMTAFRGANSLVQNCNKLSDDDELAELVNFADRGKEIIAEYQAKALTEGISGRARMAVRASLTVDDPVWDAADGEERLVSMVVYAEAMCYTYLRWGRDRSDGLAAQMQWRQYFINECI